VRNTIGKGLLAALTAATAFAQAGAQAKTSGGSGLVYDVSVERGIDSFSPQEPVFTPTCLATTPTGGYTARFPRHDPCAVVTTSTGYQITDDISIVVTTTKGLITSVKLRGQDIIGEDGIMHESEAIPILPPVTPSPSGFTLHVHADHVPIWKLHNHLGGKRVEIVGYISLWEMIYRPRP